MAQVKAVFERVVDELGYAGAGGIVRCTERPASGPRAMLVDRVRRHLPEIRAVYFADDDPLIYFSQRKQFEQRDLGKIHRKVWNDSRVPLLFAVDESHVRIYNAWAKPVRGDDEDVDGSTERLIRRLDEANVRLAELKEFHRNRLDTGAYVTDLPGRFDPSTRCDQTLLTNLEETYEGLLVGPPALSPEVAHRLLFRSILLLHLEHRGRLRPSVYGQYVQGAKTLADVYVDRDAAFRLFTRTATKFNGDLLPVDAVEEAVESVHLDRLSRFLLGKEELKSGQLALWPLYDFSVIPIQLISSLWERLLHLRDPEKAKRTGAYYTPFSLVEIMLNEVLPWPKAGEKPMEHLPTIIDPACGSGVFLVEAFRRLAARWRRAHRRSRLRSEDIEDILANHIHGIDSEGSGLAVKVAAFSLYLAMLDELDPDEPLHFPKLTAPRKEGPPNLIRADAFEQHEAASREFDLVVGNPPWKRKRLPESMRRYCDRHGHPVAGELSQPFLWLAGDMAPHGQVAMLAPSKWLFNRERPDIEFRREFFRRNHVEAVINLSALVSGVNRLFTANAPATALVFRRERPEIPSPAILYCAPRPAPRPGLPTALVIDAADVKWLPRGEAESREDVWKAMYVGGWRDVKLVRRLRRSGGTLAQFEESRRRRGWKSARGFQPNGSKTSATDRTAKYILSIPYLTGDELPRYIAEPAAEDLAWGEDSFKWTGPRAIYEPPHVLFKRAVEQRHLFATYVSQPCSFPDKVMAMHGPEEDIPLLKALTVYLNSSLASYFLFATGSSWGVDRRWLDKGEILTLPSWPLESAKVTNELARLLDEYQSAGSDSKRQAVIKRMDDAVFAAFGLSAGERSIVHDMLATSVAYVHDEAQLEALRRPTPGELKSYADAFASVFGQIAGRSGQSISWTVYEGHAPLYAVSFTLSGAKRGSRTTSNRELTHVLGELDALLWSREGFNLYRRRHVRVFDDRTVHIVKPAELRFWTQSAAFHDADEVLAQSLAGDGNGSS